MAQPNSDLLKYLDSMSSTLRSSLSIARRIIGPAAQPPGRFVGRAAQIARASFDKAILVILNDGVREALAFEPALARLARRFKDRKLHVWATPDVCDLLRATTYISRVKMIPPAGNANITALPLLAQSYCAYLCGRWSFEFALYPTDDHTRFGNWLLKNVRAKDRWIVESANGGALAHDATTIATRILSRPATAGREFERNAHLAGQWGSSIEASRPTVHFADDAAQVGIGRTRLWRAIAARVNANGIVGIVPSSKRPMQSYPPTAWGRVLSELWTAHRLMPAFLLPPSELSTVREIMGPLKDIPFVDLNAPVELLALAAMITKLDGVIGVDAGITHLALASDVRTVVLSAEAQPGRFLPWPTPTRSVVLTQRPASRTTGSADLHNLSGIDPSQVVRAYLNITGQPLPMRLAS